MSTGAYDVNGIWIYGEDDPASPFSDTLNLLANATSDEIANDRARLVTLEDAGTASAWVPSFTNASVGNGAVTAHHTRIGDLVAWSWKWVLGSTSTVTGAFSSTLPTSVLDGTWTVPGAGYVSRGSTATGRVVVSGRMSGSASMNLWTNGSSVGATSPLSGGTWVSGDVISVAGTYFAA